MFDAVSIHIWFLVALGQGAYIGEAVIEACMVDGIYWDLEIRKKTGMFDM